MGIQANRVSEILDSDKFKNLVKKRLTVSLSLTALMLIVYFGFMLTIAFYKELLAVKIGEHITIGLPIGIGVIVFAWLLTGFIHDGLTISMIRQSANFVMKF
jgi:uncharacterized membrane protein (DUF485 family)